VSRQNKREKGKSYCHSISEGKTRSVFIEEEGVEKANIEKKGELTNKGAAARDG